jgi:predicted lipoprotein with Yx(FWY)xxD motif
VRGQKSTHQRRLWLAAVLAGVAASCSLVGCGSRTGPASTAPATTAPDTTAPATTAPGTAAQASTTGAASTAAAPVVVKAVYMAQFQAKVLVDDAGYSLYVFGPDRRRAVSCTGTCALSWPPLTVPAGTKPTSGPGVERGLVSTIPNPGGPNPGGPNPGGADVVTYSGWPLYTYVADVSPGMASGEGINLNGGPWYLMRADGDPLVPAGQPKLLGAPGLGR